MPEFFGKYRGKVMNNVDPLQLGRIQVSAPAALGDGRLSWAMPCVPYAGKGVGFFAIPPVGANVWVEFEGGDPGYPIWSGCFWGTGEVPAKPAVAEMKVFKTDGVSLELSNVPGGGGFTLEVGPPAVSKPMTLTMDSSGMELKNDPVSIKATQTDIEMKSGASVIKVSSSGIEIKVGSASVKLSPPSVSINNGALEVI